MSYPTIVAGLTACFQTVTGLNSVLDYTPFLYQITPMLFTEHAGTQYEDAGDAQTANYREIHRIKHRLVLSWQDNEQCERELEAFLISIPAALKADPKLGGALSDGWARMVSSESGWIENPPGSNNEYRVCDFYSEVWEV